jgi:hypothetical protein
MSYAVSGGYPGWPPVSAVAAEDPREEVAQWPVAAVSKGGHHRDAKRDEALARLFRSGATASVRECRPILNFY